MKAGKWWMGACNFRKSEKVRNVRIARNVKLRIMNYGLGKVNFLPADDQEATQRQAGATTNRMGKASFATTFLLLLFFCFQGLLYSDIGLTLGFSYTTWNIGKLGPSLTLESSTITIYNLGNAYCQVLVRATNSENWTLSSSPGYNQFQLQIKGGDISAYQNLTTNFGDTLLKQWFRDGTDMQAWLKYYNPVDSSTDAVQHIYVIFHAGVEPGYTYNSAGDFYWRDVGAVSDPPGADWSGPYDSILPSSLWQYMTGTTVGWMSYPGKTLTTIVPYDNDYGFIWGNTSPTLSGWGTTTIAYTCPFDNTPFVRITVNSGSTNSLITWPHRLGCNTGAASWIYTTQTLTLIWGTIIDSNLQTNIAIAKTLSWGSVVTKQIWRAIYPLNTSDSYYIDICPFCGWLTQYSNLGRSFTSGSVSDSTANYNKSVGYSRIVILD